MRWKIKLRKLANELGRVITVPHPQPGKSKWNNRWNDMIRPRALALERSRSSGA